MPVQRLLRMIMRIAVYGGLLAMTQCAAYSVYKDRTKLIDKPITQIYSCIGPPNKTLDVGFKTRIVEWDYDANKANSSLSMAALTSVFAPLVTVPMSIVSGTAISISNTGDCKVIGTVTAGRLIELKFGGDNRTLFSGPAGVCEPILRGCE